MKDTKKEMRERVGKIYEQAESLRHYVALIRSMDNALYEAGSLYDVIDDSNPRAVRLKQHISDLISLSNILLTGYETEVNALSENADILNISMPGLSEGGNF